MTNHDYTHLLLIVDRSGSMMTIENDMNGGIRTLLRDQGEAPGTIAVDAWRFDTQIEKVATNTGVDDPLLQTLVVPRGSTALLDAIGRAVNDLGVHLEALEEIRRPGKVVVVIVTDGQENASREWTADGVKALVEQQQQTYGWEFLFLGANIDAFAVGAAFGIPQSNSINYVASAAGTQNVWQSTSSVLRSARAGGAVAYTDDDRAAANES